MPRNRPLIFTAINSVAVFGYGIVRSQKGPAFNDLILISNTDVQGGSFFLMVSYVGAILGSLLTGFLYGRIQRKTLMIAIPLMIAGVFTALTPLCTIYAAMVVVHGIAYFFSSTYDTTVNTEEIQAWDGNSQSAIQFLGFCYSLGGVVGPFITEPFLAIKETSLNISNISSGNASINVTSVPGWNFSIFVDGRLEPAIKANVLCPQMVTNCTDSFGNNFRYNISPNVSSLNNNLTSNGENSRLHYAYLISGATSIVVGVMAFCASYIWSYPTRTGNNRHKGKTLQTTRKLPINIYLGSLGLVYTFYFFHFMATNSFIEFLFFFVVTHLDWSKENGAYLVSMFWAIGMCMQLALAVIYRCVDIRVVLVLSALGIVASLIGFCIAAHYHMHILVWITTAIQALTQASVFAGGFAWTDGNLVKMEGKETGALLISTSLGAMIAPLPLGTLMKNWSLMVFPFSVLLQTSISATLFLIIIFVLNPFLNRRYGPLRPPVLNCFSKEDAHELMVQNECMNEKINIQSARVDDK